MKCIICDCETEKIRIIFGQGLVCSDACAQTASARRDRYYEELNAEDLAEMPDKLETSDLERWILKYAIKRLHCICDEERKQLENEAPMLLMPEQFAMICKEQVLQNLHPAYHSEVKHYGVDRLFSGGTYCLRQPVPKAKILEAAQKAELITF
jgi:hypothetical protein